MWHDTTHRRSRNHSSLIALAAAACLLALHVSSAHAWPPPGGGGGGETPTPYSLIELPVLTLDAGGISNLDSSGIVTIAGNAAEGGYVSGAYARVNTTTRKVVISRMLPEPTDGMSLDAASNAVGVNAAGVIVGGADVFDGPIDNNSRVHKPGRWIPDGTGYRFEFLPLLGGDNWGYVTAVNEAGVMVGGTNDGGNNHPAVWTADGATVTDLNALLPDDSDWWLVVAGDINDNGLIVGFGEYAGVERGYVLDLLTGAIEPIPLIAGATTNDAWKINEAGEVVGLANDGIVGGGPFPQGGWGYFWGGPGSDPVQLPSASSGRALARGLNNAAELVGDSWAVGSNELTNDGDMCVWLPGGGVTKLGTLIPTKPTWYLKFGYDINDDGWMTGDGRKFVKGKYTWMSVLLVPN